MAHQPKLVEFFARHFEVGGSFATITQARQQFVYLTLPLCLFSMLRRENRGTYQYPIEEIFR